MKDKLEILNDVKIDIDEYKEIKFDDNEELKNKIKCKLKKRKITYKKGIVVASLLLLIGSATLFNDKVWADIENIWYSINDILNMRNNEIEDKIYNINKVVEDKNIEVLFRNMLIDDESLILDINIDGNKFNPYKYYRKKQQKKYNLDKWSDLQTKLDLDAESMEVYIDGKQMTFISGKSMPESTYRKSDNTTDILAVEPIGAIIDEDHKYGIKNVDKNEFPYKIDKDKTYDIKIKIKRIFISQLEYTDENHIDQNGRDGGCIDGNWVLETNIKGEDLVNISNDYKIDKEISIGMDKTNKNIDVRNTNKIASINIKNIKISPLSVKLNYTYSNINNVDIEKIKFKVENSDDESININWVSKNTITKEITAESQNTLKDYSELIIIPYIVDEDENIKEILYDKAIKVNTGK